MKAQAARIPESMEMEARKSLELAARIPEKPERHNEMRTLGTMRDKQALKWTQMSTSGKVKQGTVIETCVARNMTLSDGEWHEAVSCTWS